MQNTVLMEEGSELSYCCWKWLRSHLHGTHSRPLPSIQPSNPPKKKHYQVIIRIYHSATPYAHAPASHPPFWLIDWYTAPEQSPPRDGKSKASIFRILKTHSSQQYHPPLPLGTIKSTTFGCTLRGTSRIICRTSRTPTPNAILPEEEKQKEVRCCRTVRMYLVVREMKTHALRVPSKV